MSTENPNTEYLSIRRDHLQALHDAVIDADEEGLVGHAEPVQAARMILELPGRTTYENALNSMRKDGMSIDGDNAYKRDLLDAVTGALAFGKQDSQQPPTGHWLEPFYAMGKAEADERATTLENLAAKEQQPLIRFGAYGVELSSEQWNCIHQMAFELGGTEGGEYHLTPEDLNELVSHVFVAVGFPTPYLDEGAEQPVGIDSEGGSHD